MMPIGLYLLLSFGLFVIGALGAVLRRNPLAVLTSIVFILTAVGINLAAFARLFGDASGQVFAFFVFIDALAQVAVGVAILRVSSRGNSEATPSSPETSAPPTN